MKLRLNADEEKLILVARIGVKAYVEKVKISAQQRCSRDLA